MSSRNLRRLRDQQQQAENDKFTTNLTATQEGEENDESEEEEELDYSKKQGVFRMMIDDSSSSEDESEEEDDISEEDEDAEVSSEEDEDTEISSEEKAVVLNKSNPDTKQINNDKDKKNEEEDLDSLLNEFNATGIESGESGSGNKNSSTKVVSSRRILLGRDDFNKSHLDLDYTLRTVLGGGNGNEEEHQPPQQQRQRGGRRRGGGGAPTIMKRFLFGKPRNHWTPRPPTYLGGGVGMSVVKETSSKKSIIDKEEDLFPPFPYSTIDQNALGEVQWHTFTFSDTYQTTRDQYLSLIQPSGDVNQLAMFVAQNPYCVDALLQLTMVFYHTGDMEKGNELLRRAVYVYECACLSSFLPTTTTGSDKKNVYMDADEEENEGFFMCMFRLMQISSMMGCVETSLAISRFVLSLDPLRDPMGVLLTLDYFALATVNPEHDAFLVDLVNSEKIKIYHNNDDSDEDHMCDLLDMPNWAFHFALAIKRIEDDDDSTAVLDTNADEALISAILKFPSVLSLLLDKNGVSISGRGRSLQQDWYPIVQHLDRIASTHLNEKNDADVAVEHMIHIFVQRSYKLWSAEHVLKWVHRVCDQILLTSVDTQTSNTSTEPNSDASENESGQNHSEKDTSPYCFSPALSRYRQCDPSDYEDAFKRLPADANPLDPALVAPALALDADLNRRRFRNMQPQLQGRGGGLGNFGQEDVGLQQMIMAQIGRGNGGTGGTVINPDDPLLEVFWRSMLPWARVDGVGQQPRH